MNTLKITVDSDSNASSEFADAFAIAKQALTYIGTYRTPPTPPIYQLWYHYVEGSDAALRSDVTAAVQRETFDVARLDAISKEYFPEADETGIQHRAGELLAQEIAALQRLLEEQSQAGSNLRQVIQSSNALLRKPDLGVEEARSCLDDVLASNIKMQARLAETELKLAASQQTIKTLRRELLESQKAMLTDNLTGIGNRRFFDLLIQQALENRTATSLTDELQVLTLVDLDGFKQINDTLGHIAGDEVLRFVAQEMQRLTSDGSVARLGGDEFGALQRLDEGQSVDGLADSIKNFFDRKKLVLQDQGIPLGKLTVSVGVAILRGDDNRLTWFERADKLLYSAKKAGKNRVMCERVLR